MNNKEFFIVRNEEGAIVGKRVVKSKVFSENKNAIIINGSLIFSIPEFYEMQSLCKDIEELSEKNKDIL